MIHNISTHAKSVRQMLIQMFKEHQMEANSLTPNDKLHHIRMKLTGSKEKISFYHFVLRDFDSDWPIDGEMNIKGGRCGVCGGLEWNNPYFDLKQLKLLAKQINAMKGLKGNLKLKIQRLATARSCERPGLGGA